MSDPERLKREFRLAAPADRPNYLSDLCRMALGRIKELEKERNGARQAAASYKVWDFAGECGRLMIENERPRATSRVSDENPKGEDAKRLSAEGIPARSSEGGDAPALSSLSGGGK